MRYKEPLSRSQQKYLWPKRYAEWFPRYHRYQERHGFSAAYYWWAVPQRHHAPVKPSLHKTRGWR